MKPNAPIPIRATSAPSSVARINTVFNIFNTSFVIAVTRKQLSYLHLKAFAEHFAYLKAITNPHPKKKRSAIPSKGE